jgi:hypothetical protein
VSLAANECDTTRAAVGLGEDLEVGERRREGRAAGQMLAEVVDGNGGMKIGQEQASGLSRRRGGGEHGVGACWGCRTKSTGGRGERRRGGGGRAEKEGQDRSSLYGKQPFLSLSLTRTFSSYTSRSLRVRRGTSTLSSVYFAFFPFFFLLLLPASTPPRPLTAPVPARSLDSVRESPGSMTSLVKGRRSGAEVRRRRF